MSTRHTRQYVRYFQMKVCQNLTCAFRNTKSGTSLTPTEILQSEALLQALPVMMEVKGLVRTYQPLVLFETCQSQNSTKVNTTLSQDPLAFCSIVLQCHLRILGEIYCLLPRNNYRHCSVYLWAIGRNRSHSFPRFDGIHTARSFCFQAIG